jgi:hypothetical protein
MSSLKSETPKADRSEDCAYDFPHELDRDKRSGYSLSPCSHHISVLPSSGYVELVSTSHVKVDTESLDAA